MPVLRRAADTKTGAPAIPPQHRVARSDRAARPDRRNLMKTAALPAAVGRCLPPSRQPRLSQSSRPLPATPNAKPSKTIRRIDAQRRPRRLVHRQSRRRNPRPPGKIHHRFGVQGRRRLWAVSGAHSIRRTRRYRACAGEAAVGRRYTGSQPDRRHASRVWGPSPRGCCSIATPMPASGSTATFRETSSAGSFAAASPTAGPAAETPGETAGAAGTEAPRRNLRFRIKRVKCDRRRR